jgi:tetratricopeptide (TPR) repeat protein
VESMNRSLYKLKLLLTAISFVVTNIILSQNKQKSELDILDSAAFYALETGKLKEAENIALQIIEKEKKNSLYLVNSYTLLGIINKNRGFYISSVENYIKALGISEKINDEGRVSACLNNIGVIYQLQHNYQLAITYFNRSLIIEEKRKNPLQKSIRYYNIAECYRELDSLDLALSYYNNSLIIEEKFKNNEGVLYAYLGIAEVYLNLNNQFQAKLILDKISTRLSNVNPELLIIYHKLMGRFLLTDNNIAAALNELDLAWKKSKETENNSFTLEILQLQIACFEKMNNLQQANKYYKKLFELQNELNNSEIKNKIGDLTYQNELTKKELEIKLVQEERNLAIQNANHQQEMRKFEQRIMLFVLFILVSVVIMIIYGFKKVSKIQK